MNKHLTKARGCWIKSSLPIFLSAIPVLTSPFGWRRSSPHSFGGAIDGGGLNDIQGFSGWFLTTMRNLLVICDDVAMLLGAIDEM